MSHNKRLVGCAVMVILSILYGIVVLIDPSIASAIAAGYIAVIVTVFIATKWTEKA